MDITAIVPVYNDHSYLRMSLLSIYPYVSEIIVIDNTSGEDC